jgi:hypothetical protein
VGQMGEWVHCFPNLDGVGIDPAFSPVHYLWITKALAGKDFSQQPPKPSPVLHFSESIGIVMRKIAKAFFR